MLTIIEARVLGCLLEKQRTTPDHYPLTGNVLLAACNQSTSREPVMRLDEHEVIAALQSLKAAGLARFVHPSHGRSVIRYRQVADEAWALDAPSAAVLTLLLLRGPQTVAELRSRSERLHEFSSLDEVQDVLTRLSTDGRVELIDRSHGQKETRWRQVVADEAEVPARPAAIDGAALTGSVADRLAVLEARMLRLETALADLVPDLVDGDPTGSATGAPTASPTGDATD